MIFILNYISNKLSEYKIASKIYYENDKKCRIYIMGSKENKINFLDFIYNNSNIYLDRKYSIYKGLVI